MSNQMTQITMQLRLSWNSAKMQTLQCIKNSYIGLSEALYFCVHEAMNSADPKLG